MPPNLRKEIAQLLDSWLEENSSAMLTRWLIEQRGQFVRAGDCVSESDPRTEAAHSVSDNFLADQQMPPPRASSAA